jgi:galactoside O-acetyltransferase
MEFKSRGKNVKISTMARFYNPEMISIGSNVRIDDFCVLSGGTGITIGSHIHIGCGCYLFGGAGITIEDFAQFSTRISVFSQSDDFFGNCLVGPQIPLKYKPDMFSGAVTIRTHSLIGTNSTIMPGVTIGEGAAIGAHSLVKKSCAPWSIYAGVPARRIEIRKNKMLQYEKDFLEEYHGSGRA